MFSSIASFIFGSNYTPTNTNSATTQSLSESKKENLSNDLDSLRFDAENTVQVTSSTPSVTGTKGNKVTASQSGKNKRNKGKNQKQVANNKLQDNKERKPLANSVVKLLSPNQSGDDSFDESDWCFVTKDEDVKESSVPLSDSEEDYSVIELTTNAITTSSPIRNIKEETNNTSKRRLQHINSHSVYSGPRPQQQRNHLQKARSQSVRGNLNSVSSFNSPTLNTPSYAAVAKLGAAINENAVGISAASADKVVQQSLYVVGNGSQDVSSNIDNVLDITGVNLSMDESWYVTPPPCFTSMGPINMVTSPFENLLIEHPSMSVYHSIRSAQRATESIAKTDLGEKTESLKRQKKKNAKATAVQTIKSSKTVEQRNKSAAAAHMNLLTRMQQVKQEILARQAELEYESRRTPVSRGALNRINMARIPINKGKPQRRADRQHCRVVSGANNNRKMCF